MGKQRTIGLTCSRCGSAVSATDAVTGLVDRTAFYSALEARVAESPGDLAVLLMDLDRFKAVNDTLGHTAGDALLAAAGRRLRRAIRPDDIAARLGGDEFAVLLGEPASREAVAGLAARVIDLMAQPYLVDGRVANVGASAGAVLSRPGDGASGETLMRQADLAMYQAKATGRGRFAFFEPSLQERAEARRSLELDLRGALALEQFELFYQPQVDVQNDGLTGFEALIRWRHPVRGLVPPDSFINVAEEIGLISSIGAWVIATACHEAMRWPGNYTVAVNVAAQQFEASSLVPSIEAALRMSRLPSARLEIEVTETALLRAGGSTLAQLEAIKALGVQVSLDDFGTGYSSLTQLRSFAFDRVKIDRSFVDDEAVVRAVAALGRSLGMRTTAEGIETPQQMARLRTEGCTEGQGYLLSRPVPVDQIDGLIERLGRHDRPAMATEARVTSKLAGVA
jgi:diguanylate cyclase (GGDEF)-like protein